MDKNVTAETVLERNRRYIPGGISSVNRSIDPAITFARGEGAYLWDTAGKRYIDYHAGFAPYFLGHNFAPINEAAAAALKSGDSLFGAGPSKLEGDLGGADLPQCSGSGESHAAQHRQRGDVAGHPHRPCRDAALACHRDAGRL